MDSSSTGESRKSSTFILLTPVIKSSSTANAPRALSASISGLGLGLRVRAYNPNKNVGEHAV